MSKGSRTVSKSQEPKCSSALELAEGDEGPVVVPPVTDIAAQVELAVLASADEVRRIEVATEREEPRVLRDRGVVALGVMLSHPSDEGRRVTDKAVLEVFTHLGGGHEISAGLPDLNLVDLSALVCDEAPLGKVAIKIRELEIHLGELDECGGGEIRNGDEVAVRQCGIAVHDLQCHAAALVGIVEERAQTFVVASCLDHRI